MRGLLVGRFQPFHLGHLSVVRTIRAQRADAPLILGIGSAQASHTADNPFTAGERFEMISRALAEAGVDHCEPVPLFDIDRHAVWVAHLTSILPPFDLVYTNNPLTRVLFEDAGFRVEAPALVDRVRFEGTSVRRSMVSGDTWRECVPTAVATYLREIHGPERLRLLALHDASGAVGVSR
ncbi:MAG: nicotinamide-nucleotide adenylyltransferase [Thermoplasmata archaeon]|nr:nicotinamide-nucleotide adenylyltransferase [Thermoplasmata archaeon]